MESRDEYLLIELVIANVAIREAEFWLEQGKAKNRRFPLRCRASVFSLALLEPELCFQDGYIGDY